MTASDFESIKALVKPLDTAERRARYLARDFPRADRCKDVGMRYRWDLFYLSGYDSKALYGYLDDRHIDTALLRIVQPDLLGATK